MFLASGADDNTCLMILKRVRMVPLLKCSFVLDPKNKCPAALILPLGLERYESSEWRQSIISLAKN